MMAEVEHGIVKFFDERDGRKYGFIRVLDSNDQDAGEEIFFHYNDGKFVSHDRNGAVFADSPEKRPQHFFRKKIFGNHPVPRVYRPAKPREGDRVVFVRKPGKENKPKASPWAHEDEWQEQQTLKNKPTAKQLSESRVHLSEVDAQEAQEIEEEHTSS